MEDQSLVELVVTWPGRLVLPEVARGCGFVVAALGFFGESTLPSLDRGNRLIPAEDLQ
jgi:hypothetical protein